MALAANLINDQCFCMFGVVNCLDLLTAINSGFFAFTSMTPAKEATYSGHKHCTCSNYDMSQ